MFSITTIESSTTRPIAIVKAPSVRMLREYPNACRPTKVISTLVGIEIAVTGEVLTSHSGGVLHGIAEPLPLGVRALDTATPCGRGQRIGIFAGSGVGKSSLLAQITRGTVADVRVIGLIGERGREVREFLENDLGPEGLARSVVVVATSDEPALVRLRAAFTATRIAESPRPMPHTVRLPYIELSVAKVDAVTSGTRVLGLVTIGPTMMRSVEASIWL